MINILQLLGIMSLTLVLVWSVPERLWIVAREEPL